MLDIIESKVQKKEEEESKYPYTPRDPVSSLLNSRINATDEFALALAATFTLPPPAPAAVPPLAWPLLADFVDPLDLAILVKEAVEVEAATLLAALGIHAYVNDDPVEEDIEDVAVCVSQFVASFSVCIYCMADNRARLNFVHLS